MVCQSMCLPPISIIGLGLTWVSSLMRVPSPPARITAFMGTSGRRRPARLRLVPPRTSSTARRGTRLRSATHARELKRRAPVTRLAGSECRELECPPGLRSRPLPHCRADGAAPRPGPVAACRGELNRRAAAASLDPLVRRSLARNQPHDFESVRADRHRLKSEPGLNPTKRIALQRAQALTRADRQESAQHAQGW